MNRTGYEQATPSMGFQADSCGVVLPAVFGDRRSCERPAMNLRILFWKEDSGERKKLAKDSTNRIAMGIGLILISLLHLRPDAQPALGEGGVH
jgi:hypothetical protein